MNRKQYFVAYVDSDNMEQRVIEYFTDEEKKDYLEVLHQEECTFIEIMSYVKAINDGLEMPNRDI